MSVSMFIILLAMFSTLTALFVEAEKKLLGEWKVVIPPNTLALLTALVIGWVGTFVFYMLNDILCVGVNLIVLLLMGFASGLCSMVGYDKVVQTIQQFKG